MDATIAVSEGGVNTLLHDVLAGASVTKAGNGTWGPFFASYSVTAGVGGGTVELVDSPVQLIRVHDLNVFASVTAHVGFDLGLILPRICIPPFRVCIDTPFGHICTPQWCIPWPHVDAGVTIPISLNVSADFGIQVHDGGSTWDIVLLVYPFSLVIDPTPTVDAILNAVEAAVDAKLNAIPGIGSLIAELVNTVIGALKGVIDAIAGAIDALVHEVILLLDIFSPTIPVKLVSFNKVEVFLPAGGPGDPAVSITLAALGAQIDQHELVAEATFA